MSTPRKKKDSRKDQQQNNQYSYVLGENLHLTRSKHTATQENDVPNPHPARGRRSTDRDFNRLHIYWNSLSPREQDVTILVCKGHEDAKIASILNISFTTVRSYLKGVFHKTNVRNRKQLIVRFSRFRFPRDIVPDIPPDI
jgi:DNA-binding CsgD family transcriptional regulator